VKRDNWWAQYLLLGALIAAFILLVANIILGWWAEAYYETEVRLMHEQAKGLYESVDRLNNLTEEDNIVREEMADEREAGSD